MISVENLTVRFERETVLENVSFRMRQGERAAVIGASGAGKSQLLRSLNGLTKPAGGTVRIGGQSLMARGQEAARARMLTGMVFQQFNLFSHLRAVDNIAIAPIRVAHASPENAIRRAEELLALVGLSDKRNAYPSELSGGQQQRVAIARSLAMDPQVLLFDEPTSALDPTTAAEILALIRRIASDGKRTILIVTHEMQFIRSMADRVFFLSGGGIHEEGTPEELFIHPQRENTRAFLAQLHASPGEEKKRADDEAG